MALPSSKVTDRAKRYRAQSRVTGPRRCVICGSRQNLGVMHLTGNENHGEPANLAWGCKSCNGKLGAAFKSIGAGRPTNQYNPSTGVPTYEQYKWAVRNHTRKEHDEGGAVIHATPKHKRIQYAKMIAAEAAPARRAASAQRRADFEDRWNPAYTREQLERMDSGKLDKMAFGFASGDVRNVPVSKLHPTNDDIENAVYKASRYPGGPRAWAKSVDFSEPIEVVLRRGKLEVKNGHHRYYAARLLGKKTIRATVEIDDNAIDAILGAKSNPWPFSSPGRGARQTTPASGGIAYHSKGRKASAPAASKKKSAPAAGFSRVPDEKTIQEGFARGLSLAEILRQNPAIRNSSIGKGYAVGRKLKGASDSKLDKMADDWIGRTGYYGASIPYERDQFRAGLQRADDEYRAARAKNPADYLGFPEVIRSLVLDFVQDFQ